MTNDGGFDGECGERRDAAVAEAAARNLQGLVVCSRGGGTLDRYANLMYLTNFYTAFPYIPDRPPRWSARAHAFLVLPVAGHPVLIVDVPHHAMAETDGIAVVVAADMVEALTRELEARGLGEGGVGIVGADTIPWSVVRQLEAALPGIDFVPADDVLDGLRMMKSPREIALLKQASAIGSRAIDAMMDAARTGVTHAEVYLAGLEVLIAARAIPQAAFMLSGRGGDNPTVARCSFPTYGASEPLAEGQWFQVGLSGVYEGYYFDLARSTPVGTASERQIAAFEAAIASVQASIDVIRPGVTAAAVAAAGLERMRDLRYGLGGAFSGMGHGIGLGWDDPWLNPGDETVLAPGMVLCVERGVKQDGFSGDFEETVLVTDSGCELLTSARVRRW